MAVQITFKTPLSVKASDQIEINLESEDIFYDVYDQPLKKDTLITKKLKK